MDPDEYEELIKSDSICQQQSSKSFDAQMSYEILCNTDEHTYMGTELFLVVAENINQCNNR